MLQLPESMDECAYFTNRKIGDGQAKVWVFRQMCPECGKALMGKPVEKGKVKVRAKEYVCPECKYTETKDEYEPKLTANVQYTCPSCKYEGEKQVPYKRKNIKGVPTLRIVCDECGYNIDITKKMKEPKKKT
ncbi:MAG: hypothetical protein R6V53_05765 [Candidatus Woesearchaeota archaeon]